MDATEEDRDRLAAAVRAARIKRGFPKRAAYARHLRVNDSTLAIIENARPGPISDEMLDYVTEDLGWAKGSWRAILAGSLEPARRREASEYEAFIAGRLRPELRRFTDTDLVDELRNRMLYMAAKLGGQALEWRVDDDGDTELVSHSVSDVRRDGVE